MKGLLSLVCLLLLCGVCSAQVYYAVPPQAVPAAPAVVYAPGAVVPALPSVTVNAPGVVVSAPPAAFYPGVPMYSPRFTVRSPYVWATPARPVIVAGPRAFRRGPLGVAWWRVR